MRTGHSLTVCWSPLLRGGGGLLQGVLVPEGRLVPEGCALGGGCLLPGGVCLGGVSAPWGVCAPGGSGPGGCLLWGGVCSGGVSAPRGSAPGGVWSGGIYPSMHWGRHPSPPWTDRRLWKYYLGPTLLRPVIISLIITWYRYCNLGNVWTSNFAFEMELTFFIFKRNCENSTWNLKYKERKYVTETLRRQQCRIFCLNNYEKRNT